MALAKVVKCACNRNGRCHLIRGDINKQCVLANWSMHNIPSLLAALLAADQDICQLAHLKCALYSQPIGCTACSGLGYMSAGTIGVCIIFPTDKLHCL